MLINSLVHVMYLLSDLNTVKESRDYGRFGLKYIFGIIILSLTTPQVSSHNFQTTEFIVIYLYSE